jgi:hypothetical protein
MKKLITSVIAAALVAGQAFAMPVSNIDVGDGLYLSKAFENELVYVVRVDYNQRMVKVRHQNGYTEWVDSSRLLSYEDSYAEDAATVVVGGILLLCLMSPDTCEN